MGWTQQQPVGRIEVREIHGGPPSYAPISQHPPRGKPAFVSNLAVDCEFWSPGGRFSCHAGVLAAGPGVYDDRPGKTNLLGVRYELLMFLLVGSDNVEIRNQGDTESETWTRRTLKRVQSRASVGSSTKVFMASRMMYVKYVKRRTNLSTI